MKFYEAREVKCDLRIGRLITDIGWRDSFNLAEAMAHFFSSERSLVD
jgi:hypothetical protein